MSSGTVAPNDYGEFAEATYADALNRARMEIQLNGLTHAVVQVGPNVIIFADTAGNGGEPEDIVALPGRTLSEISSTNVLDWMNGSLPAPPPPPPPPAQPPEPEPPAPPANSSSSFADFLQGAAGDDEKLGGDGNDTITDAGGHNYLRGEEGDDTISGGSGFDDINGNRGDDTASGGDGGDWVVGGKDQDLLFGDGGGDIVYGNVGHDTCLGGSGDDIVRGGQGDDSISGDAGNDWLSGDRGDDVLAGGSGADMFHTFGEAGVDRVLDFNRSEGDRVMLTGGGTYTVSQVGADAVISMSGGGQMILVGVSASSLTGTWIFEA